VEDEVAATIYPRAMNLPAGQVNKATLKHEDARFFPQIYAATVAEYRRLGRSKALEESMTEYAAYLERARQRLGVLKH